VESKETKVYLKTKRGFSDNGKKSKTCAERAKWGDIYSKIKLRGSSETYHLENFFKVASEAVGRGV
jgi:hypothetical protein